MSGSPQSSINNCESVLNKISNLYCNRLLSDVILKVGLQEYPAHRLILCASSAVFQVMLLKPEWSESCEQVVVLHEAEECEQQFGTFLQYLYTGRVVLTDATVLPILALADKYNVQDLRVVCGSYMKQHVVSAAEHNFLLSWLQYCLASQHTAAATACLNHFKWNFEQVARTSDFLNCDVGLLTSVLAQHDLVVHDEMTLYMYLVQWLEMQKHRLLAESDSAASSHCASPAPPSCLIQPPLVKLHPKLQLKEEIKEESSQSSPSNFSLEKSLYKKDHLNSGTPGKQSHGRPSCGGVSRDCNQGCFDAGSSRMCPHASHAGGGPSVCSCSVSSPCWRANHGISFNNIPSCAMPRSRFAGTRCCCSNMSASPGTQNCPLHSFNASSSNLAHTCFCSPCHVCQNLHANHCGRSQSSHGCCSSWTQLDCTAHRGHSFPPILPSLNCNTSDESVGGASGSYFPPFSTSRHKSTGAAHNSSSSQPYTGMLYLRCSSPLVHDASIDDDIAQQIETLTYKVMSFVRFPMMTPRQIAHLLPLPLTIQYKEFFITRMAVGVNFQSGEWWRLSEVMECKDESLRLMFVPRLYTAELWSAGLTVDNLPALPPYHSRTLFFSTPASVSEQQNDERLEWIVELYPKGVWFRKYFLIVWQGTVEVPEVILRTVRLSITHNTANAVAAPDKGSSAPAPSPRVRLAVLVSAYSNGVEFVSHVVTKNHIFSPDDCLLNMDDILPFDSLNDPKVAAQYLLPPCDSLKLQVVISPLSAPAFIPSVSS
ncbi:uncharacterized protein LOC108667324 [Hyalella azteca]|uniref:Uncharacterized protein LOC108667324 n=1 Tax=Hyalella azteca TaxID=294128 RepID=A0A8B7N957_HYAAZ|nr:uncharacterized protein LOC108667324 [Hyalella azteca]